MLVHLNHLRILVVGVEAKISISLGRFWGKVTSHSIQMSFRVMYDDLQSKEISIVKEHSNVINTRFCHFVSYCIIVLNNI